MSATINSGKLKFSVFGNGFDQVRNDSGDGFGMTSFAYACDYCAFDVNSRYCWIVTKSGDMADRKIRKLDTTTWQEVHHAFENVDVSTQYQLGLLTYIENDTSNLGVLVTDTKGIVVFDLTTDEIICELGGSLWEINQNYYPHSTHKDGIIRIVGTTMNESYHDAPYATIDIPNETYAKNEQAGGYTISGFYNDTDITFANRSYGDRKFLWGGRINSGAGLSQLWGNPNYYPNVTLDSFASNDYLYFPTHVGETWQFGKYPIPPDIQTPSPIEYMGINADTLATPAVYTRGRTWASFLMSDNSLAVTDFRNCGVLYKGDSPKLTPKAMGDPYILCAGSDGYTYLARYK